MSSKLMSLAAAAALIPDGATVGFGGSLLQRIPAAFARELARQGRRGLGFVKSSSAYDLDLLIAAGCVERVEAGIVTFEPPFGPAPNYRRAIEDSTVFLREHACIGLAAGLRAAAQGVPFMPVAGLNGSDIPAASGFKTICDPYTGAEVYVIPRIAPDWAVLHVQEADACGNARVYGTPFWDRIMSRAANRLIITAERIIPTAEFERLPELTLVPGFLVTAVVEAPGGAWPGACWPDYAIDEPAVWDYLKASREPERLTEYLTGTDLNHEETKRMKRTKKIADELVRT